MNRIELELKLKEIDQSSFQRICDYILSDEGFNVVPYGNCEGVSKTRKGTPDSYILDEKSNSFIFVEYTTQKDNLDDKIISDIEKCLEKSESLNQMKLTKILYFCNSNNISPVTIDSVKRLCSTKTVDFKIYTNLEVCNLLKKHRLILKEMFNDTIFDNEIYSLDEFIYSTKKYKGVDHSFKYYKREEDEEKLISSINNNFITLISGEPGVGKSMLVVQTLKQFEQVVYCINSSNEESIEKLNYLLEKSKDLILFIDDVNEISSFSRLLNSIDMAKKTSSLKIVCTIREYALSKIYNILNKFDYTYKIVRIDRFKDDAIKTILSTNLNICNDKWLERICILSKGNPRLAFMAGKVAIDRGVKNLIDSKTIMREYFTIANSEAINDIINEYYDVLGVIAFLKRTDIEDEDSYKDILTLCKINFNKFKNSITLLRDYELIDIFEDRVLQINDQNLSDFLIEKAFIEKKICTIFDLITKLIVFKKGQIVDSLNIILNIYSSKESRLYLESEIKKSWDYLADKKEIDIFIKVFYLCDTTRALIYCYNIIKNSYKKCSLENINIKVPTDHNDYIEMIFTIARQNNDKDAFNLLLECLDYEEIRNYALGALKRIAILKPELFYNGIVNNDLIFIIKEFSDKIWFQDVLQIIINESLKFDYEFSQYTNDKNILFNHFSLKDTYIGIIQYRNKIWNLTFLLDDEHKYDLLKNYQNHFPQKDSKNIFKNDIKNINVLIESIENVDYVLEKILKVKMLEKFYSFKMKEDALKIHDETDLDLYLLIIDPKDKYLEYSIRKTKHHSDINEFIANSALDEIKKSLVLCDSLLLKDNGLTGKINIFLELLFKGFNAEILTGLLDNDFLSTVSSEIKIQIVKGNYFTGNNDKALEYLFARKEDLVTIECFMEIFNHINENDIDDYLRGIFNDCFERDLVSSEIIFARRIDTLLMFSDNDLDFIDKIQKIFQVMESNKIKAQSWFGLLFNEYCIDKDELIGKFVKCYKLHLLEEIVLYFVTNKLKSHDLQDYVYSISNYDIEF